MCSQQQPTTFSLASGSAAPVLAVSTRALETRVEKVSKKPLFYFFLAGKKGWQQQVKVCCAGHTDVGAARLPPCCLNVSLPAHSSCNQFCFQSQSLFSYPRCQTQGRAAAGLRKAQVMRTARQCSLLKYIGG